jgi:hypothetical protein
MKTTGKCKAWRAEGVLPRLRRCLAFLRRGNFISAAEQEKVARRIARWKKREHLRLVNRSKGIADPKPSEMRDTIEERFRQFHFDNPDIYKHIVKLTLEQYRRGRERLGMKALWEQIRWHIALGTIRIKGEYKLNNNYTSRYVRMLIEQYPAYRGLFERRRLLAP